jgi:opacity protein-like surface antigen
MRDAFSIQQRSKRRFGAWGLAAACAASATPFLEAQDNAATASSERFYAGLDAGAAFVMDFNLKTESPLQLPFLEGLGPVIVPSDFQQRISMDPGVRVNGSFGVRFWRNLHLEIQPGWIWSSGSAPAVFETLGPDPENPVFTIDVTRSDIELTQIPILGNIVGIVPINDRWNVRVGLGAGVVFSNLCVDYTIDYFNDSDYGRINAKSDSDYDVSFAYQVKASLEYSVTEDLAVGIGYQFLGVGETYWELLGGEVSTPTLYTHSVVATVNLKF